uniref:Putative kunitz-type serine protease inhibitor n=1 Tax=Amblyomma cajennense TaxID=34607 RepID=A0A023FRG4_AMBCJ
MKYLVIILLSCWSGAVLGVGGGFFSTPTNWPRNFSSEDCKQEEKLVGRYCGDPFYERRYFYNRTEKRCVLFIPVKCGDYDVGNNFAKRKDCMKTCMKGSPCRKTKMSNENGTIERYTYHPGFDMCISGKYKKKAQLWPAGNIFETAKKCQEECAPELPF